MVAIVVAYTSSLHLTSCNLINSLSSSSRRRRLGLRRVAAAPVAKAVGVAALRPRRRQKRRLPLPLPFPPSPPPRISPPPPPRMPTTLPRDSPGRLVGRLIETKKNSSSDNNFDVRIQTIQMRSGDFLAYLSSSCLSNDIVSSSICSFVQNQSENTILRNITLCSTDGRTHHFIDMRECKVDLLLFPTMFTQSCVSELFCRQEASETVDESAATVALSGGSGGGGGGGGGDSFDAAKVKDAENIFAAANSSAGTLPCK